MQTVTVNGPQIISEDDDVLVVDKPGGLVCHSASRNGQLSLAMWLRERGIGTPRMANRLDRETSGLVIVSKNERAARSLGKQVLRREIKKEYVAICWGEFDEDRGVVDQPIGLTKDSAVYTKRVVCEATGKPCVTEFAIELRLKGFAVARLWPRTGRAHQLRVHMAWLGHPIVGDKVYGSDETLYLQFIKEGVTDAMLVRLLLPRHALHAERVAFRHPRTQQECRYEVPMPEDMQQFIGGHS